MAATQSISRSLWRTLISSHRPLPIFQTSGWFLRNELFQYQVFNPGRRYLSTSFQLNTNDGFNNSKYRKPSTTPDSGLVAGQTKPELAVGEMEGITFKVEPLKRTGEDDGTKRARLLYQCRKRGTLESDLLLSTFASLYLAKMPRSQLDEFDRFLDENDWDIYYWATQEPPTEGDSAASSSAKPDTVGLSKPVDVLTETWKNGAAKSGEWAQTVGAFKPAYRPVPQRWAESEILVLLRQHVKNRSAAGSKEKASQTEGKNGGGLGRMPDIEAFTS
ncbi:succinate dehydrogenase assembly factor 2 [Myotisia sp. PD_48]|nr:succinate dehydrogenase assembly factor 2 [Myotisia sp. PD_48]